MGSDDLIFLRKNFKVFNLNFFYFSNYFGNAIRRLIIHAIKIVNEMKVVESPKKQNTLIFLMCL